MATLTSRAGASFFLTGTVSKTSASSTVTGAATSFLTDVSVGDRISIPGGDVETKTIIAIASNTSLQVDADFENSSSGETATILPSTARFDAAGGATQVIISDQGLVGIGTATPEFPNEENTGPLLRLHAADEVPLLQMFTNGQFGPAEGIGVRLVDQELEFLYIDSSGTTTQLIRFGPYGALLRPGAGIEGLSFSGQFIDDNYAPNERSNSLFCDAGGSGITISLPSAVETERVLFIFKVAGAGNVTIAPDSSDLINGVNSSITLSTQWSGIRVQGMGSNWIATSMPAL